MSVHDAHPPFDFILVGGGLSNGLIALAGLDRNPSFRVAIVERDGQLAGNHTWCLHPEDAPDAARRWLDPILRHRWAGYDVHFPSGLRRIHGEYAALTSPDLRSAVERAIAESPGSCLHTGRNAVEINGQQVTLEDGTVLHGRQVIDGRGPGSTPPAGAGFQKFVGLELDFERPHGLCRPMLMDATVDQTDGFRFMYLLPFGPTRLLVEDTTFAHGPKLDDDACREAILAYARRFGAVREVVRSERGVLPMPYEKPPLPADTGALRVGYAGGFFHPATGYSFHAALRIACHVAEQGPEGMVGPTFDALRASHERQASYARRLNWLLFHCFETGDMRNVFERFYRLPEPLIHRFYAMALSRTDRFRILFGQPPKGVSLKAALGHLAPAGETP